MTEYPKVCHLVWRIPDPNDRRKHLTHICVRGPHQTGDHLCTCGERCSEITFKDSDDRGDPRYAANREGSRCSDSTPGQGP